MYTDVVGYSKLTGDNQEIALIILEEHNKILNRFTKRYSGDIVKLTGDGLCALFDSPVDAIKSAIEIQRALDKRNRLNVKERQIQIEEAKKTQNQEKQKIKKSLEKIEAKKKVIAKNDKKEVKKKPLTKKKK